MKTEPLMAPRGSSGAPLDVLCLAARDKHADVKPWRAQRRAVGEYDVLIDMRYCGICHSDLHFVKGDVQLVAGKVPYPFVAGHELSGIVSAVGARVTKFRVGDAAGVGCMVDSCLACAACKAGEEQKCSKNVATYGAKDRCGRAGSPCGYTLGGYTTQHVVHESFGVKIPAGYPLEAAGPVMCSGVTLYDPMRVYGVKAGTRVGVIGIGGLGSIGVKIAKALGATVTAVTRSAGKAELARKCGADAVVISSDAASMAGAAGSIDLLLNTIPFEHDFFFYNTLLAKKGGQHVVLGLNTGLISGIAAGLIVGPKSVVLGSGIGGIRATQEVVDLCAKHSIFPETQIVGANDVNGVYEKLEGSNDSGVRYVLDIATITEAAFDTCTAPPPKLAQHSTAIGFGGVLSSLLKVLCCPRRGRCC